LLVEYLKSAVGLELRAAAMYGHMATYCRGQSRLLLSPFFEGEAAESVMHLGMVRQVLADLDVEAPVSYQIDFSFDSAEDLSYSDLLTSALEMETQAHQTYMNAYEVACELPLPTLQRKLEDLMDQERESVLEVRRLLG